MFFKKTGILGINARNLLYIRPYNKKKAIKLADDKIKTKQFLAARGVPVPRLFNALKDPEELERFDFNSLPNAFVVKPNNGYGGEGIIPIANTKEGEFFTVNNSLVTQEEMSDHIRDILDGRFSISNVKDTAFFEQLIIADDKIAKFSYAGLPDIRIVVHNLIPVMAMLRLPTKESKGKANLHMGAVGVGIDIAKGEATHIVYKNRIIDEVPEKGVIRGFKIPYWDEMLEIASKIQLYTNLGYMAVDLCLDKNSGPVLLEINARAGLGVQIANLAPLRKRLERIQGVKVPNPTKGVRIAKDMFGNSVEKSISHISGKEVIGTKESTEIITKNGVYRVNAKIDIQREHSAISKKTAEKFDLLGKENHNEEKDKLKLKLSLKNKRFQTIANLKDFEDEDYQIILGRRDLSYFLVDPSIEAKKEKTMIFKPSPKVIVPKKINYHQVDQNLINIDKQIKLIYHLKPLDLDKIKAKFFKKPNFNPQFEYPKLKFDPLELNSQLEKINLDDSPIGKIFAKKKAEVSLKIKLLESIDEERFTRYSQRLFSIPKKEDFEEALEVIKKIEFKDDSHKRKYDSEYAKKQFEKTFKKYGLDHWKVKIKEGIVANCIAGKNNRLFVKKDAMFTKEHIASLITHEIETHIITAENGKTQPYQIFNRGLGYYLKTQEGLAVYNVEKNNNIKFSKSVRAHTNVMAIYLGQKLGFKDIYHYLRELNVPEKDAFTSTLKAKRGLTNTGSAGVFTKDFVYMQGYKQIKQYLQDGGDIKNLYIGKMDISDVEESLKIPNIKQPKILPDWL
jgi:alpha-L-glutamate ligase-like protein/uncharacterized protein (TIGR02421 family)